MRRFLVVCLLALCVWGVFRQVKTTLFAGPYPRPVLTCSVRVGTVDIVPDYCGATPEYTAGELQVNVKLPMNVPTGDNVPVQLTVGDAKSPLGVTIAIQ